MGIQPEKEREGERERERERERHGGNQISKKLVQETGPSIIVQKAFYTF